MGIADTGELTARVRVHRTAIESADESFIQKWNDFVGAADSGHLQQGYEHVRLKRQSGWVIDFLWTEGRGIILSGAAVMWRSLAGHTVFANIPCGPVWAPGYEHTLAPLFDAIGSYCRGNGTVFCRIHPSCSVDEFEALRRYLPTQARGLPYMWSYWNFPRVTMQLDIDDDMDSILNRMHPKTRNNCRRSLKRGVAVREADVSEVGALAALMSDMAQRKEVLVRSEDYYRSLLTAYPRDRVGLILADIDGRTVGASLLVCLGKTTWSLYSAFDNRHSKAFPNEALQMTMIEWARARHCVTYDLGGTCSGWPPNPRDKGYGVYAFKKRLGARTVITAPYVDIVYRPGLYKAFRLMESVGLPLYLEKGWGKFVVMWQQQRWTI